ncbi:hypothetical protein OAP83_01490 [Rickettsiales bacterium]|nr:hypothetical protein [Rickettsiales bacterium]
MTEDCFIDLYPELYQFLGGFIIQCYENKSDDEIINEWLLSNTGQIISEAKEVLKLEPFPKDIIEEITNIWHENISTEDWFKEIIDKLEQKVMG